VLVNQGRALVDYYIELTDLAGDGKAAANWIQQDVLRTLNERQITIDQFPVRPRELADLLRSVRSGKLDNSRGRDVLGEMIAAGKSAEEAMDALGIRDVDETEVANLCRDLLAANPKVVAEIKEGKLKGVGALIGQAKKRNPNVNPNHVRQLCLELIEQM